MYGIYLFIYLFIYLSIYLFTRLFRKAKCKRPKMSSHEVTLNRKKVFKKKGIETVKSYISIRGISAM